MVTVAQAVANLGMHVHVELRLDLCKMCACMCGNRVPRDSLKVVRALTKLGRRRRCVERPRGGGKRRCDGDSLLQPPIYQEKEWNGA
jgi:molybdate-binding protein